MLNVEAKVRGISPLLLNRKDALHMLGVRAGSGNKKSKTAASPTPEEMCKPKLYLHPQTGVLGLPAQNLLACLIEAGQYVRLDGKRQVSTTMKTTLPGFLTLDAFWLDLIDPDTGRECAWEVDIQGGRNPNGGEGVAIVRPRLDRWAFTVAFTIDEDVLGENVVRQLWDIAGRRIGLGDFRPPKRGTFGRFTIDHWKRVDLEAAAE